MADGGDLLGGDLLGEAPRGEVGDEVVGEGLTAWSVLPGGRRVHLGFEDASGRRCRLNLPFDALSALLLTIPRIMGAALRARGDPSARVIQPLGSWHLERAAGTGCLILTLSTPNGFDVAFTVAPDQLAAMGEAAGADRPRTLLN